ncbi:MAG: DUF1565 domain-containing protein [Candidatus Aminicenantes bacterium]|nr:MAG: DUF1565 domain-containing protein [Candidatus Aminicenantes bacterium]
MANYYVDCYVGSDTTGTGSSTNPFKTITHALDVAVDGDMVRVRTGMYDTANGERFPIKMKEGVALVGVTVASGPVIRMVRGPAGNYYPYPIIYGGRLIGIDNAGRTRFVTVIGADRSFFSRFVVFTLNSTPTLDNGVGILCWSTSPRITYNDFVGDGRAGISILESGHPDIRYNKFRNIMTGSGASVHFRIFHLAWGITARGEGDPNIYANKFYCYGGIDITMRSRANVNKNEIFCVETGIRIQDETSPTIIGNMIAGHYRNGIAIVDSPTPLFEDNWIAENGSGGPQEGGVLNLAANPDFGGGSRGSRGGNVFHNNNNWDLINWTTNPIFAMHNTWTHSDETSIDRNDIFDHDEEFRLGEVNFMPFRT